MTWDFAETGLSGKVVTVQVLLTFVLVIAAKRMMKLMNAVAHLKIGKLPIVFFAIACKPLVVTNGLFGFITGWFVCLDGSFGTNMMGMIHEL